MTLKERLNKFNYELPEASTPGGSYVSVNIREKIAYVAIFLKIILDWTMFLELHNQDIKKSFTAFLFEIKNLWQNMYVINFYSYLYGFKNEKLH